MERRDFLKLAGITGAGTLTACDQKVGPKYLIPYLVPHEDVTPGIPTWYASTCRECPAGCGTHVKTREGRVIKLEGNPESPVNRGKLCARGQAAHQHLYDPDRLEGPKRLDGGRYVDGSWDDSVRALAEGIAGASGEVVLLTGLQTGTLNRFYDEWAADRGVTRVVYEPFAHEPILEAHRRVFGQASIPAYDIAGAEFVISFGADFLETWVSPVRYSRDWAAMHAVKEPGGPAGVFVAVEPRLSMTASNADEWLAAKPGTEHLVALAMANVLGAGGESAGWSPERAAEATGVPAEKIVEMAHRFGGHRSVALPGGVSTQHAQATAAAMAVALLNQAGGAVGDTVRLSPSTSGAVAGSYRAMADLTARMKAGRISAILFAGTNPAYALPPGLGFTDALKQVGLRVSFDPLFTETASWCHLLLPDHTPLESWGDWEPEAGVASIVQPAMTPIRDTRATADVLLAVRRAAAGEPAAAPATAPAGASLEAESWYDYLRAAWSDRAGDEQAWAALLKAGVWTGAVTAAAPAVATPSGDAAGAPTPAESAPLEFGPAEFEGPEGNDAFHLLLYPQIAMYDGRNANQPWLQELPDPATTSSWHTWVEVNGKVAERLELEDGDVVRLESPYGSVEAPVIVYPGVRSDTVAMPLGRGHARMGRYAKHGVNPVTLLPPVSEIHSGALAYQRVRVSMSKTGAWVEPLKAQGSDSQHGRGIAQAVPLAEIIAANGHAADDHGEAAAHHGEPHTRERAAADSGNTSPYRWGMAISVDSCIGCNACVAACSAENNLPFVGPERVAKSRQMHWIRIERYFEDRPDGDLETRHVPMLCQHCGAAPCEPVCPVYATYHNMDGLNVQVYNRCVGTRYCANNCPYKVRYFNWFNYEWPEPLNWGLNPDVTTREVGVMEKCSYCVQRINAAKIAIKDEAPDAVIPDGYFQTACQQTCPTDAITFGNLKDPASRVARLAEGPLAYSVFEHLNTRPANFYLRQVTGRMGAAAEVARAEPEPVAAGADTAAGGGGE
ncbi:MAG TPA: 4Fe-4S dicluster domain-containing protein [Gemmatimonadota bacterium]|nr:4Fe-4S dicluster domain-containing protein [Gemmatimonadota bacterium]